ncbi:Ferredoxin (modular protein) [Frankia sp. AgKG'84/4]|nr:ferredoxin family protein [Frankia sp. AgKG'84/4]
MAYIVSAACVDITDRSCVEECPVDCVYEGRRKLFIHPEECIDCGACALVCPVEAIVWDRELDGDDQAALDGRAHLGDAHTFFYRPLPGRAEPIGAPGWRRGPRPARRRHSTDRCRPCTCLTGYAGAVCRPCRPHQSRRHRSRRRRCRPRSSPG